MEILELLKELTAVHGPSGDEGNIRAKLAELAAPFAAGVTADTLGNLIVHKPGDGPRVMFAAHMDSTGFIVTHIEKEGFLRVGRLGGIAPKEAAYTPIRFKSGVQGVFVPEEKAEFGKLKLDECFVDIGAKDEAEAKKLVQVGDTAVYDAPLRVQGSRVTGPYLDDRLACAVLLAALEQIETPACDLYMVFTVQEEVGLRGARTAAWQVEPDICIAVDVTDVDDTPGSEKNGTSRLGKGAAVKVMDSSVLCHPLVVSRLEELARAEGIAFQRDVMQGGGTDAGAIHTARLGVKTGGISVPCRYIHTPAESADLEDAACCVRLLRSFCESVKGAQN